MHITQQDIITFFWQQPRNSVTDAYIRYALSCSSCKISEDGIFFQVLIDNKSVLTELQDWKFEQGSLQGMTHIISKSCLSWLVCLVFVHSNSTMELIHLENPSSVQLKLGIINKCFSYSRYPYFQFTIFSRSEL